MKTTLLQQQTLKLAMTAELRQAIHLLQYNIQDLTVFLYEQAEENPLIELGDFTSHQRKQKISGQQGTHEGVEGYSQYELSLSDYLTNQLREVKVTTKQKRIAEYIICTIDGSGYLKESMTEMASFLEIDELELNEVVTIIHSFEPAGVGARNVKECLLLQLQRLEKKDEVALKIVGDYFDLFVGKNVKALAAKIGATEERIRQSIAVILSLQPKPGAGFSNERPTYVIPDVIVEKQGNHFSLKLNEKFLPTISVGSEYTHLMKSDNNEVSSYVKDKYKQVNWIMKSLEQRRQTLTAVVQEIITRQSLFFEKGPMHLRALGMKDVAESLGVHESTVSRTVKNKYVETPFGLYEMKHFFSRSLATGDAEAVSTSCVKQVIKELVANEGKKKPLSDQKIADLLKEKDGTTISRRTVTKYREQLGIPSSSQRKAY